VPERARNFNGYQDEDGCPDEVPAALKKFTGVIEGITFKTNSANLTKKSYDVLDRAVQVLSDYPDTRIEISGHTDNVGKTNTTRSCRRSAPMRSKSTSSTRASGPSG